MLLNTIILLSGTDFFSRWLAGWNLGGLILVLVGAALLIVEMLIPGFGIAGISGAAAVIAGLIIGSSDPMSALFSIAILVVILCIAALIIFKVVFGKRKNNRHSRIVLDESIAAEATDRVSTETTELVGKRGTALTALRPSGAAIIDGKRYDVLAKSEFIAKDEPIVVCAVEGLRISVCRPNEDIAE